MANVNAPIGLKPYVHGGGGKARLSEYSIASEYAANICRGDPVEITGTGDNIQLSAATNVDSTGVFAGCRYVDSSGAQKFSNYWPASTVATDIVAYVWDDPNQLFEVQADTLAAADIGLMADWNAGTASTTHGRSGGYIAASGGAATGRSFHIMHLIKRCDNAIGAYAKVVVKFGEHRLANVISGVGGVS